MSSKHSFLKEISWPALVILLLNIAGCASGTASGRSGDPLIQLQNQIVALRSEVNQSLRRAEKDRATLSQQLEPLQRSQADYLADSEELKSRLQAIETRLNEYSEQMIQLAENINNLQTKIGDVLEARQIGSVGVPNIGPNTRPVPSQVTGVTPDSSPVPSGVTDATLGRSEITAPLQPSQPPPLPPSPSTEFPGTGPEAGTTGTMDPTTPEHLYQIAYNEYTQGNYDVAIAGFQKYLELYPNRELADFSQYWIAESFFNLREYETALKEYDKLINLYPRSKRLSWAYYNKAQAFLKLGKQIEAISHLRYILNQFPNSEVADKARQDLAALGG